MRSESGRSHASRRGSHSPRAGDSEREHTLKNHLAVILGFCELLLGDTPPDDSRHADLLDMQQAAKAAIAILDREPGP